jgi:hypothetical protein
MIAKHMKRTVPLAVVGVIVAMVAGVAVAGAAPVASKFVFSSHFGWKVDATTGGNVCTVASKDKCREEDGRVISEESSGPGGFSFPQSVAVDNEPASPDSGDVYVDDVQNGRVQVLSATGAFVSMFGWEVNRTKDETLGATQAEKNVCTAESKDACKAGVKGGAPGQIYGGLSIAVDAVSGDVYLAEIVGGEMGGEAAYGYRVQEFTATGTWVLAIGKEVNETKKTNLCTEHEVETEGVQCKGPVLIPNTSSHSSIEHGVFNLSSGKNGNVLAVGGPEDLLYVGDEHRVQEFSADGEWKSEISLASISSGPGNAVLALAVDATGDVYLTYGNEEVGGTRVVREFNPSGVQSAEFEVSPKEANPLREAFAIRALALDPHGRLGVITTETIKGAQFGTTIYGRGVIYSASGVKISEFAPPSEEIQGFPNGLAFAASDALYVVEKSSQEVEFYTPALFPEAVTCPATEVEATSVRLCGEINANGLFTRGFFDYAPAAGSRTPVAFEGEGTAFEPVAWHLTGLEPNQTYQYETVAEAEVNGEEVTGDGEQLAFHTPTPPPVIPGVPSASDVTDAFAVLSASVDPEHATARYHFEYGPCGTLAGCGGVVSTPDEESSLNGSIGTVQESEALQPQTTYSFRLVANNRFEYEGKPEGGDTLGAEGHFTTGASPVPSAQTGSASAVTATSALIAGTVDPDGQPAAYAFELGVYNGASTQYGIVLSGPAGASGAPVAETLPLSGLQPGVTYAYRIVVKSGYGEAIGATLMFTTEGLPSVLAVPSPLAQLAVPSIAFPAETKVTSTKKTTPKCKRGKKLSHGACVKVKAKRRAKKAKKSSRSQRSDRKS